MGGCEQGTVEGADVGNCWTQTSWFCSPKNFQEDCEGHVQALSLQRAPRVGYAQGGSHPW